MPRATCCGGASWCGLRSAHGPATASLTWAAARFYVTELLEAVGREGSVVGVDASADMLTVAAKRAEGHGNVAFHRADATSLPVPDASFERAVCVQVLEYVHDVPAALSQMHRALRPGGRVLVWDVDWASVSWHAIDRQLARRVLAAWDKHLTHPSLPRTLAAQLRNAGFADVRMDAHAFATTGTLRRWPRP
jgi:arsenite methyltransferase